MLQQFVAFLEPVMTTRYLCPT